MLGTDDMRQVDQGWVDMPSRLTPVKES